MPVSHGRKTKALDAEDISKEIINQWYSLLRIPLFRDNLENISLDTSSFFEEKDDSAECKIEDFKSFWEKWENTTTD